MRLFALLLLGATTLPRTARAQCTHEKVVEAIQSTVELAGRIRNQTQAKPFDAVKQMYESFLGCDDGGPGEGMSDVVVASLAADWATVSNLFQLMASHPSFRAFVFRHVDATCDTAELRRVQRASQERCPRGYEHDCEKIHSAASNALQVLGKLVRDH